MTGPEPEEPCGNCCSSKMCTSCKMGHGFIKAMFIGVLLLSLYGLVVKLLGW